ncbi:MAG: hypothetical protein OXI19_00485, partial [Gemmatimonadota bacterium]|nr:hypothetical protein [Gemmatimonadota bacterium]
MSNAQPHNSAGGEAADPAKAASAPGGEAAAPARETAADEVGYMLHVFHRAENGRDVICGVGKLHNGQTFQFMDDRVSPTLYVRVSEQSEFDARIRSDGISARVVPSEYTTMDGEPVAGIQFGRVRDQRNLVKSLEVQQTRTYEGDIPFARQYLIGRGLRGGVRISGAWTSGDLVDRVYANPELEPEYWEPAFSVLALDIETDPEATTIYAVGLVLSGSGGGIDSEEIHMVGEPAAGDPPHLVCWPDEASMLRALSSRVLEMDPDLITGWNLVDFDLQVLQRRF